jgi:hypothetical protein
VKKVNRFSSITLITLLLVISTISVPSSADDHNDDASIDVRYLQTCLKTENSSLDVLVLMDSSRSLRKERPGEGWKNESGASDPKRIRGPILKSSLKLLQELASDSDSDFSVSLRNFGDNTRDLAALEAKWLPWTPVDDGNSQEVLSDLVSRALYDDSKGTDWGLGLDSARIAFGERLSKASSEGKKSCPIMFWITDGAPTDKPAGWNGDVCLPSHPYSVDWFKEKNILVLGGLLKKGETGDVSQFTPIVQGTGCEEIDESWTRGSVIEARDINSLAWGFVSLIASIKNLVNLEYENGKVDLDRGTSKIEIFVKGIPAQWQVKKPDGTVFCSSDNPGSNCEVVPDPEIQITTISVTPDEPSKTEGTWSLSPDFGPSEVKVYGGLSVEPNPVKLVVATANPNITEGNKASFSAKLVNADGSLFDISGFKSVRICATLESDREEVCKSGSASTEIDLYPSTTDSSVPFTAELTSNKGEDRRYNVSAVVNVSVEESGKLASLVCGDGKEGDTCKIPNLANKSSKKSVSLKVLSPTDAGASGGQVYIVGFDITKDKFARNFTFNFTDRNGNSITPGDVNRVFTPGDTFNLEVSFDKGGASQIEGVIKYAVVADGQKVVRQLNFEFEVKEVTSLLALILLMLAAYLVTFGLPYAFLMWSARRAATLNPPEYEIAYLVTPFTIDRDGKLTTPGEDDASGEKPEVFASPRDLIRQSVEPGSRSISVAEAEIKVIPPKWNPFVSTVTQISVPGNHLLATVGSGKINEDQTIFAQSLVNQALLYFPTAENLDPVEVSTESRESAPENLLSMSSYETVIKRDLVVPQGSISGKIIFIVPSYGAKRKSLDALIKKLKESHEFANFKEAIPELRAERLKKCEEEIAATLTDKTIDDDKKEVPGKINNEDDGDESEFWGGSKSGGVGLLDGIDDDDYPSSGKGSKK